MLIIVISVVTQGPHVSPELKGDPSKRLTIIGPGVFQAIGVISFAFVCHHNSLLIYGSLQKPTIDRFARVTHISTVISLVACCTLAIPAFWNFTNKTQGNILNNFPPVSKGIWLISWILTTAPLERHFDQSSSILLRVEHVYHVTPRALRVQGGE